MISRKNRAIKLFDKHTLKKSREPEPYQGHPTKQRILASMLRGKMYTVRQLNAICDTDYAFLLKSLNLFIYNGFVTCVLCPCGRGRLYKRVK